ncbi:MAG: nucleotidyltransferase domain-containing protein [Thermoguttaceae bacterium]
MNQRIRNLTDSFRRGLESIYQARLKGVYLFGSHARGDAGPESDVDLLVVLDHFERYGAEVDRTSILGAELSLAHAVSISEVFVNEHDWSCRRTPFLDNVRREAVRV